MSSPSVPRCRLIFCQRGTPQGTCSGPEARRYRWGRDAAAGFHRHNNWIQTYARVFDDCATISQDIANNISLELFKDQNNRILLNLVLAFLLKLVVNDIITAHEKGDEDIDQRKVEQDVKGEEVDWTQDVVHTANVGKDHVATEH